MQATGRARFKATAALTAGLRGGERAGGGLWRRTGSQAGAAIRVSVYLSRLSSAATCEGGGAPSRASSSSSTSNSDAVAAAAALKVCERIVALA